MIGRASRVWSGLALSIAVQVVNPLAADSVEYLPPTSPMNVLENIVTAHEERDFVGYLECLADDFTFVPHPNAQLPDGTPATEPWDRATAEDMHRRMFDSGSDYARVVFASVEPFGNPYYDEAGSHPDWLVCRVNITAEIWLSRHRWAPIETGHTLYMTRDPGGSDVWQVVQWVEGDTFVAEEPPEPPELPPIGDESVVYCEFAPEGIRFPNGVTRMHLRDVYIQPEELRLALVENGVDVIARAFPEFDLADTLGVARYTGELVRLPDMSRMYVLESPSHTEAQVLADALSAVPGAVRYFEIAPETTVVPWDAVFPNDDYFEGGEQWGLHCDPGHSPCYGVDINAPEAWGITTGSSGTRIGVWDWGFMAADPADDFEDLAERIDRSVSEAGWDSDHGVRMACVAGAMTNNTIGVAGMDWNASLISRRLDNDSTWQDHYDEMMYLVTDADADIVNCSWSYGDPGYPQYSLLVHRAFANAYKLNRVVVAAMGNNSAPLVNYPAGFDGSISILAVGATNWEDEPSHFSTSGDHIDVAAPGEYIYTCDPGYTSEEDYGPTGGGTSGATAFVSGLAALMLAERPDLYNDDIEQIIRLTADDIDEGIAYEGFDPYTGTGRIDAGRALEVLQPPYKLAHYQATGASRTYDQGSLRVRFVDEPGLNPNFWQLAWRHKVERDVTFSEEFWPVPHVWSRGAASAMQGYPKAEEDDRLFGDVGWCGAKSITGTGCTLVTYVYAIYDLGGLWGWVPCEPDDVSFAYTVFGPTLALTGVPDEQTPGELPAGLTLTVLSANPAANHAKFAATLPSDGRAVLRVFNAAGRLVRTLCDERLSAGRHVLAWDCKGPSGHDVSSGVYYALLETERGEVRRRMVVVK